MAMWTFMVALVAEAIILVKRIRTALNNKKSNSSGASLIPFVIIQVIVICAAIFVDWLPNSLYFFLMGT